MIFEKVSLTCDYIGVACVHIILCIQGPTTSSASAGADDSATTRYQDAAAAVRDTLQAVRAAAPAVSPTDAAAADGSSGESLKETVMRETDESVSQVEERTKASQESALQVCNSHVLLHCCYYIS